jgi:redox-sensitive bicupin YhaK (pirin superfamily)
MSIQQSGGSTANEVFIMTDQIRTVSQIITPIQVLEGAGVLLKRSIATRTLDYLDPFLLLDHFGSDDPADYLAGFPMHPHRGIETVTYMLAGHVDHRDSMGNQGTIGGGDVQWMTAGRGIMHEEMPKPFQGKMEGFQLWVNLPARLKMTTPRYQDISSADIPEVDLPNGGKVRLIAGHFGKISGAVTDIFADPTYLDVTLPAGSSFSHNVPTGQNAFAYLFRGEARFGSPPEGAIAPQLVIFGDGSAVTVQASDQEARFILVSGQPLGEPIARYGPFVMNTRAEIEQTLQELRNGTFIKEG